MERSHDPQPQEICARYVAPVPFLVRLFRKQVGGVPRDDPELLRALRIIDGGARRPAQLHDPAQRCSVRPTAGTVKDDFEQSSVMASDFIQV
jgi:hypothetical protein